MRRRGRPGRRRPGLRSFRFPSRPRVAPACSVTFPILLQNLVFVACGLSPAEVRAGPGLLALFPTQGTEEGRDRVRWGPGRSRTRAKDSAIHADLGSAPAPPTARRVLGVPPAPTVTEGGPGESSRRRGWPGSVLQECPEPSLAKGEGVHGRSVLHTAKVFLELVFLIDEGRGRCQSLGLLRVCSNITSPCRKRDYSSRHGGVGP